MRLLFMLRVRQASTENHPHNDNESMVSLPDIKV